MCDGQPATHISRSQYPTHIEKKEIQWLKRIPGRDFQGAVSFLNSLDWNLSISESDDEKTKFFAGDRLLFSSENEQEAEAFIFGMALGLAVLPGEILDHIREFISPD